jgi:hypothetical protein
VMPGVAEDLHRNQADAAIARVRDANHVIAGVMLAATTLVVLFGDRLLALFEPAFASAHHVLVILVASQAVRALAGPASKLLIIVGHQRHVIIACPLALILLGASIAILIPLYGLTGAALAVLITITAWSLALSCLVTRTAALRSHFSPLPEWLVVARPHDHIDGRLRAEPARILVFALHAHDRAAPANKALLELPQPVITGLAAEVVPTGRRGPEPADNRPL